MQYTKPEEGQLRHRSGKGDLNLLHIRGNHSVGHAHDRSGD